jgi:hypothetical protein
MNIESMGDGSFLVHLICKDAYDVKLQLPPGWHRHEFEIGGNDNCTIRCCRTCGKTSKLDMINNNQWQNVSEGE